MQSAVYGLNLIVDKYLEGHLKSTLERKLTEPELAVLQATKTWMTQVNIAVVLAGGCALHG